MSDQLQRPLEYATPLRRSRLLIVILVAVMLAGMLLGFLLPIFLGVVATQRTVTAPVPPAAVAIAASSVPSRMTIVQRGRAEMPGTGGAIVAHIGDITGGQTLLTVEDANGKRLLNTVSVREREAQMFAAGGVTYEIELIELRNFLTGDDFAVFEVRSAGATTTKSPATAPSLSEAEKIERLIAAVASARDMRFIRNGKAHSAADAADHLRRKYESARDRNLTARQFIEHIASKSSISGKPYRVRLRDGSEQASAEWLSARLSEIESPAPATPGGNASTRPS